MFGYFSLFLFAGYLSLAFLGGRLIYRTGRTGFDPSHAIRNCNLCAKHETRRGSACQRTLWFVGFQGAILEQPGHPKWWEPWSFNFRKSALLVTPIDSRHLLAFESPTSQACDTAIARGLGRFLGPRRREVQQAAFEASKKNQEAK